MYSVSSMVMRYDARLVCEWSLVQIPLVPVLEHERLETKISGGEQRCGRSGAWNPNDDGTFCAVKGAMYQAFLGIM